MEPYLGEIMLFAGPRAPEGWAQCDGQLMPIAANAALFSILATTYGGDGRKTFALPDLRGRVPIGAGQFPGLESIEVGQTTGSVTVLAGMPISPPPVLGLSWCISLRGHYPSPG
jgi:microcystin-dependent protein